MDGTDPVFLRTGPRRFGDLRRDLAKVSKVLGNRLRVMQGHGLLERGVLWSNPPQVEYSLTQLSRELDPIPNSMEQVARRLKQSVDRR